MNKHKVFLGSNELLGEKANVNGTFVDIEGEKFYKIENYQVMPDFFISIVSNTDHWMFISSNGSLAAGRKNRDNALFPYYTVDKIHDYKGITGSDSSLLMQKDDKTYLWEPFTNQSANVYHIQRNLYKSIYGNKIIFEEINEDLGLSFQYGWYNSEKYGFVKKSRIVNNNSQELRIEFLDGLKNILPYGLHYAFQNEYSNLLDAYKKNELVEGTSLALFMLSSIPVDKAEPSEALKTTTVWSAGLSESHRILISANQLNKFKMGYPIETEYDIRASRGAYFVYDNGPIEAGKIKEWLIVAEINQDSRQVSNLRRMLEEDINVKDNVQADIRRGTEKLKHMVSYADGFQMTGTDMCYARHYSNTLYNIMRGGIFIDNYQIDVEDFKRYVWQINKMVSKEFQSWLNRIPESISYMELIKLAEITYDKSLIRITYEYLPLTFSRRHGDPSRPWNLFSIETRNDDGSVKFNYEGNWRDIFQNWEALSYSFPGFLEGMISKFVNASTIDGYNPYRIKRDGIDWECPDPEDPWAYIGYWGDHQIIYLQKLLELSENFHPGKLDKLLIEELFVYANVPYRIKAFEEIVKNPSDTVEFDHELNNRINNEAEHLGADARMLKMKDTNEVYTVNLMEKILATLLSKLSNFIPEAGIWLNTQRPEWNDANNALVGNGTSMVTLYYLRRFLNFWKEKLNRITVKEVKISEELVDLFFNIKGFLGENIILLNAGFSDSDRLRFAQHLGQAHSRYRNEVYNFSFSGIKKDVSIDDILDFVNISLNYIDQSIKVNKRNDGLYHAYNLISVKPKSISIRYLYEMLEGQVAALSSGMFTAEECLDILDSLKNSKMFRSDQYSYMLYPDRELTRFIDKNIIPEKDIKQSPLLLKLLADKECSVVSADDDGRCYFNGDFRNAQVLEEALDKLRYGDYSHLVEKEKNEILAIYEKMFDHQSFTGRSGTFYGYEGLGSIYWHMVSKLLLATQESYYHAIDTHANSKILGRLKDHFYEIKAGIGIYKSPDLYGSFPMDAYSHTPAQAGVKQPGLTGQVKEDFIARLGELGVRVREGVISFDCSLLNSEEILRKSSELEYFTVDGEYKCIQLKKGQLAFTLCQVPIIYSFNLTQGLTILNNDGKSVTVKDLNLTLEQSASIFKRKGIIDRIEVGIDKQ